MPNLPDHLPGERLLMKMWDSVQTGVSALNRRWLYRRDELNRAKVDVEALRIRKLGAVKVRSDLDAVRRGVKQIGPDFSLIETPVDYVDDEARSIAEAKQAFLKSLTDQGVDPRNLVEIERHINLDQIELLVIEQASNDKAADADEAAIDVDWFSQWRNRAQDVSNEDMQGLWAKVRLGEMKKAKSYSMHTLEFLSRMSRDDAELISALGSFAINRQHVFREASDILDAVGLDLTTLLYLQDIAILGAVDGLGGIDMTVNWQERDGKKFSILRCCQRGLVIFKGATERPSAPVYVVSSVGRELLQLATCHANEAYLNSFANKLRPQVDSIKIGNVFQEDDAGLLRITDLKDF